MVAVAVVVARLLLAAREHRVAVVAVVAVAARQDFAYPILIRLLVSQLALEERRERRLLHPTLVGVPVELAVLRHSDLTYPKAVVAVVRADKLTHLAAAAAVAEPHTGRVQQVLSLAEQEPALQGGQRVMAARPVDSAAAAGLLHLFCTLALAALAVLFQRHLPEERLLALLRLAGDLVVQLLPLQQVLTEGLVGKPCQIITKIMAAVRRGRQMDLLA